MEVGEGCSVYYLELIKAHGFATVFLAGRRFHAHRQTRGLLELARSPDQPRAYKDGRLQSQVRHCFAAAQYRGRRLPRRWRANAYWGLIPQPASVPLAVAMHWA